MTRSTRPEIGDLTSSFSAGIWAVEPAKHRPRLVKGMFGGVLAHLGRAQLALRHQRRQFHALELLGRHDAALPQRPRARRFRLGFLAHALQPFHLGCGFGDERFCGPEAFFGFAARSRVEKRRQRGKDGRDDLVGRHSIPRSRLQTQ